MPNNFQNPFVAFETASNSVSDGDSLSIPLGQQITMQRNYYGIGYLQLYHELRIVSVVGASANVGSVLDESTIRRDLGTWHREQDGYVEQRFKIEHPNQIFSWEGNRYTFERSNAADPGQIVPAETIGLNFVLEAAVPIKVEPASLTLLAVPTGNSPTSGLPTVRYVRPVPQYKIERDCMKFTPQEQLLTFNFSQPNNYKTLDPIKLQFDSDTIVVRPLPDVAMSVQYNSYIIICSEDTPSVNVRGGGRFGACLPTLPAYPPEEPPNVVLPAF
jgi:hypothetical protein